MSIREKTQKVAQTIQGRTISTCTIEFCNPTETRRAESFTYILVFDESTKVAGAPKS